MQKTRSIAIDLVRVIAITAVVVRHTWYDPEGVIAQVICPWAIAVFFVLTGYLWSSRKDLSQEIDSRFTGLLHPVRGVDGAHQHPVLHLGLSGVPGLVGDATAAGRLLRPQLMVLPFSVSWFFTVMFIAVVLLRFLGRYPRQVTWALLGASSS